MQTSIIWFKNNLRLLDNEVVCKAIAESERVVPVYCIDEAHFETSNFGFEKTGSFRANFLFESLIDLDNNLRAKGSGLLIVKGKPEKELLRLAQLYNANTVYTNFEIAPEEIATENKVKTVLINHSVTYNVSKTSTLYAEKDLPFSLKNLPDIFTSFRKKIELDFKIRVPFEAPSIINSPVIEKMVLPNLENLGLQYKVIDTRAAVKFRGGETEALKRMHHYFYETKAISNYKETRNGMIGADYSSKFSAWLANGCISPVTIYHELKEYETLHGANESTYWLIFELLWRDYFYFVMQKFENKLFLIGGIKQENNIAKKYNKKYFTKWIDGETGVDFIDANMLELKLTGFMSNRGRQNVASFLVNDLKMDWRYGAAYFEQQLVDYDVSSNWGNWAYIAGVGNDPRPNRYFNIAKQANDYDANGSFRDMWLK